MASAITPSPLNALARGSIAVAVRINPSRWMRLLFGAMSCLCLLIAVAELLKVGDDISFALRVAVAAISLTASLLSAAILFKRQICPDIHITGTGEIHFSTTANAPIHHAAETNIAASGHRLAPGSLVTPVLLILRLADNHGKIKTLLVFPDSVSNDAFRRLSIACRWIAVQKKHPTSALFK